MAISFMCTCVKVVIHRSFQFYNTQRIWQPLWWRHNVCCFTVEEAIRRAHRKLPNVPYEPINQLLDCICHDIGQMSKSLTNCVHLQVYPCLGWHITWMTMARSWIIWQVINQNHCVKYWTLAKGCFLKETINCCQGCAIKICHLKVQFWLQ